MPDLLAQLREAIKASGVTRYRIAKDLGMSESQLSRLMTGEQRLSIPAAERLAEYLGYTIELRPEGRGDLRRKRG